MPADVALPIFDGGRSSQESLPTDTQSVDSTTPRSVPLVDLPGSPTSKRRQPSSSSSRRTPRRPDLPPDHRGDYRRAGPPDYRADPVWVPGSAPTRLANGYRQRGSSSPSNSMELELSPRTPASRSDVYGGQLAHGRVAALQSHGRTPVCLLVLSFSITQGCGNYMYYYIIFVMHCENFQQELTFACITGIG